MPKIRYLKIRFTNKMFPYEAPYFRAAVVEMTKRQSVLFHNHYENGGFRYDYPLIQYKVSDRKATIICLNDGTDDIHYLLQNRELRLQIGNRPGTFEIEDVHLKYFNVQTWQGHFHYSLRHWMALNQENFRQYQQIDSEVERLQFLEKLLTGQILAFAEGVGWRAERPIEVSITKLKGEKYMKYKDIHHLCFTLNFRTNVSLPDYIGIGKAVSVGYGMVKRFGKFGNRKSESRNRKYERGKGKSESRNRKYEVGNGKSEI